MRPLVPSSIAALLAALLAAPPAPAEEPAAKSPGAAAAPAPQKKAGKGRRKAQKGKRAVSGPVATFPGFRLLEDGTTRVYVELSEKVAVEEHKAEGRVAYRLKGAAVPTRTNRLPLETSFFKTPVARVQLVESDEDVDLVIELSEPAAPTHRLVQSEGGVVLEVDFPAPAKKAGQAAGGGQKR